MSSFFSNFLDSFEHFRCKKTYLTENSSTETEYEYQCMHGAYIRVTGSNVNAERSITIPRYYQTIKL